MEDWKMRLREEYLQLKERYVKLTQFLAETDIPSTEYKIYLMKRQKRAMLAYMQALEERADLEGIDLA